ncbi:MAG: hypothetical protein U0938_05085 [Thiobacillus sp.]|nr:hypothetical protein [Thiobacillus sp.]
MGKAQELIVNERIAPSDLSRTGAKGSLMNKLAYVAAYSEWMQFGFLGKIQGQDAQSGCDGAMAHVMRNVSKK